MFLSVCLHAVWKYAHTCLQRVFYVHRDSVLGFSVPQMAALLIVLHVSAATRFTNFFYSCSN